MQNVRGHQAQIAVGCSPMCSLYAMHKDFERYLNYKLFYLIMCLCHFNQLRCATILHPGFLYTHVAPRKCKMAAHRSWFAINTFSNKTTYSLNIARDVGTSHKSSIICYTPQHIAIVCLTIANILRTRCRPNFSVSGHAPYRRSPDFVGPERHLTPVDDHVVRC